MRVNWTDDRLDERFDRVDSGLRDLRNDVNDRFERVDGRFDRLEARFDAMQHTLIQLAGGMLAAFGAAMIGLIATQL